MKPTRKPVEALDGKTWYAAELVEEGDALYPKDGDRLHPVKDGHAVVLWSVFGKLGQVPKDHIKEINLDSGRPRRGQVAVKEEEMEEEGGAQSKEGEEAISKRKRGGTSGKKPPFTELRDDGTEDSHEGERGADHPPPPDEDSSDDGLPLRKKPKSSAASRRHAVLSDPEEEGDGYGSFDPEEGAAAPLRPVNSVVVTPTKSPQGRRDDDSSSSGPQPAAPSRLPWGDSSGESILTSASGETSSATSWGNSTGKSTSTSASGDASSAAVAASGNPSTDVPGRPSSNPSSSASPKGSSRASAETTVGDKMKPTRKPVEALDGKTWYAAELIEEGDALYPKDGDRLHPVKSGHAVVLWSVYGKLGQVPEDHIKEINLDSGRPRRRRVAVKKEGGAQSKEGEEAISTRKRDGTSGKKSPFPELRDDGTEDSHEGERGADPPPPPPPDEDSSDDGLPLSKRPKSSAAPRRHAVLSDSEEEGDGYGSFDPEEGAVSPLRPVNSVVVTPTKSPQGRRDDDSSFSGPQPAAPSRSPWGDSCGESILTSVSGGTSSATSWGNFTGKSTSTSAWRNTSSATSWGGSTGKSTSTSAWRNTPSATSWGGSTGKSTSTSTGDNASSAAVATSGPSTYWTSPDVPGRPSSNSGPSASPKGSSRASAETAVSDKIEWPPAAKPEELPSKWKYKIKLAKHTEPPVVQLEESDRYLLTEHFPGRVSIRLVELSSSATLEKTIRHGGCRHEIVCTKMVPTKGRGGSKYGFTRQYLKAFYVTVSGPGLEKINLKERLEALGDFAKVDGVKVPSRLELLVSPAAWATTSGGGRKHYIFHLRRRDIELIPENFNEGAGFIPQEFLQQLLLTAGTKRTDVCRTDGIQVRLDGVGIYKGVLGIKDGIKKVQLPPSMCKVQRPKGQRDTDVVLLIRAIFPSDKSLIVGRHLNPDFSDPPPSSEDGLKSLGYMLKHQLRCAGCPADEIETYDCESLKSDKHGRMSWNDADDDNAHKSAWERRSHAYVKGEADPTGAIPKGHVFITGMGVGRGAGSIVYMTRTPCTEKNDGRLLSRLIEKPGKMSDGDWDLLKRRKFGTVVFGPPLPGEKTIPEQLACGDLDGDLYFVLWDERLVSYIQDAPALPADADLDELLGSEFPVERDGKMKTAVINKKMGENEYLCSVGKSVNEEVFSRDQILQGQMGDRRWYDAIAGHRGKGKATEVKVVWSDQTTSWEPLHTHREKGKGQDEKKSLIVGFRDQAEDMLARYAIAQKLMDKPGWKWAKAHIESTTKIEAIVKHKGEGSRTEVQVRWEDKTLSWVPLKELKEDEDDAQLLAAYARKKQITSINGWKWAGAKQYEEKDWFESAQDLLIDIQRWRDLEDLKKCLHTAFKAQVKRREDDPHDRDAAALGLAYKQSLDLPKHGGLVELPCHLRKHIKVKRLYKYIDFKY